MKSQKHKSLRFFVSNHNPIENLALILPIITIVMLGFSVQQVDAGIKSTSYNADTNELSVTINYAADYNDLRIQCDKGDNKENFEVTEPGAWSVDKVGSETQGGKTKYYLKLVRSSVNHGEEETVKIEHKDDKGRGKRGRIKVTLNGKVKQTDPEDHTFLTVADIPTVSQWGLIIMAVLLVMAGAIVILRRQRVVA